MLDCLYPDCEHCFYDECIMNEYDIVQIVRDRAAMHSMRKVESEIGIMPNTKNCERCSYMVRIDTVSGSDTTRLCTAKRRLISDKTTCPNWCGELFIGRKGVAGWSRDCQGKTEYDIQRKERRSSYAKRVREERKAAGMCVACGKVKAMTGMTMCRPCHEKQRLRGQKVREKAKSKQGILL